MKRDLAALANNTFDVLIIGGGIFGAGVARDASLRGLKVALIDKADFASGTSSRSSKLIHGGFRYLEQREFGLVAEASRERHILRRIAPHLVKPLPFLLPVYEGDARPLWKLRIGMTLYDLLAKFRNTASHKVLSREAAVELEPGLSRGGLRGALHFYDCQEDDARFCIENILHAADLGATCANYLELTGFTPKNDQIVAANAVDRMTGSALEIRARAFVNAAGPWVEHVAQLGSTNDSAEVRLSPTKGVHLILPRLTIGRGIFFQARRDARMLFLLPWHDCSMLGTTDTDFTGDPATASAEPADVEYLLSEIRHLIPGRNIGPSDVITTFAGVRSLLQCDSRAPTNRPREERIVRHVRTNLVSIAGGKYTTYRAIAEKAVDAICEILGVHADRCRTASTALPDHRPAPSGKSIADVPLVHASDVVRACTDEMAMTVEDVMRRRTSLALSRHGGPDVARTVADLMARQLAWNVEQTQASVQAYLRGRSPAESLTPAGAG